MYHFHSVRSICSPSVFEGIEYEDQNERFLLLFPLSCPFTKDMQKTQPCDNVESREYRVTVKELPCIVFPLHYGRGFSSLQFIILCHIIILILQIMTSRLTEVVTQKVARLIFKDSVFSTIWLCIPSHLWALGKVWSGPEMIGSCSPGALARGELSVQGKSRAF